MRADEPSLEVVLRGHKAGITSVAFTERDQLVSGSLDSSVMVWKFMPHMRPFRFAGHKGPVHSVAVDHVGGTIASASQDRTIRLWKNSVDGRFTVLKGHFGAVRCVCFARDGKLMMSASDDKTVRVWVISKQRPLLTLSGHSNWVRAVAVSADSAAVASGGDDMSVRVWDPHAQRCCTHLFEDGPHGPPILCLGFQPLAPCIAAGSGEGTINVWDLRTRRLAQRYAAHGGAVSTLAWHTSGAYLVSGGTDALVRAWDVRAGQLFFTIRGHRGGGGVASVAFSPCGRRFTTGGLDGQAMVWRAAFERGLLGGAPGRPRDAMLTQQHPGAAGPSLWPASPAWRQPPPSPLSVHPLSAPGGQSALVLNQMAPHHSLCSDSATLGIVQHDSRITHPISAPSTGQVAFTAARPASSAGTQAFAAQEGAARLDQDCSSASQAQKHNAEPLTSEDLKKPDPVQVLQKLFGQLTGAVAALEGRMSQGEQHVQQMCSMLAEIGQKLGLTLSAAAPKGQQCAPPAYAVASAASPAAA